jgi:hypothetical protein
LNLQATMSALTTLLPPLGLYTGLSRAFSIRSLDVWLDLPPTRAQMDIMKCGMSLGLREGIIPIGTIISVDFTVGEWA